MLSMIRSWYDIIILNMRVVSFSSARLFTCFQTSYTATDHKCFDQIPLFPQSQWGSDCSVQNKLVWILKGASFLSEHPQLSATDQWGWVFGHFSRVNIDISWYVSTADILLTCMPLTNLKYNLLYLKCIQLGRSVDIIAATAFYF